ncbi:MAG TPA: HEPN domain-containing protein [Terriglobales bacterium]|nr:HEPN domain-containing protein [Terriglobales bacterium]
MGQAKRDRDTSAALACAEAFQRIAEPLLPGIAQDVEGNVQFPHAPRNIGDLVVAAVNLAFAVELYIKALLAEFQINVPQTHDLGKLYDAIPQSLRNEIEKSYDTNWREHWYGKRASITIAKGPLEQPEWRDYRNQPKNLGAVLERSGDVFTSWRYIYEFTEPGQGSYQFHDFEYGLLLSACNAIRAAIILKIIPTHAQLH